jgi:hypothetical protein
MSAGDVERSESGNPIYRHQERKRDFTLPERSCVHLEEIEAHLERYVGPVDSVFHELLSDLIHLDVLIVRATADRPYHLVVTSGVSDEPMNAPAGMEEFNRVELLMALPPDWPLTDEAFNDEANYWPISWLKQIGRLPHEYDTWIGYGHTIPNGDPPERIANTGFIGVMLTPAYWLPAEFFQLATAAGETIHFFSLLPLYQEEMDLKLKKGAEELERRLDTTLSSGVLDIHRPNVAQKKRWFW